MRPLDRYRQELRRKEAVENVPGFARVDAPPPRSGPVCIEMVCKFVLEDGSEVTLQGVWPSVEHLPLEVLARNVVERAAQANRNAGGA